MELSIKNNKISVLILTYNEEINIAQCIHSVAAWCDDIVVLDSYSTDKTGQIVSEFKNARFIKNRFVNYAKQRNFGLNEVDYKHKWLLMVDADEAVDGSLALEMFNQIENIKEDTTMFRMRRKDFFEGKWIRRSSGYPTWFGRLMKIGHVKIEREINEEFVTDGNVVLLKEHLIHYPFSKGFSSWLEKHNKYSSMEAELIVNGEKETIKVYDFFSIDAVMRRKVIKNILYRSSFRPLIMFLALYVLRLGFLDGSAGLRFSILRSFYEYMIECKVDELCKYNRDCNKE